MRLTRSVAAVAVGLGFLWVGAPVGEAEGTGPGFTVAESKLASAVQCDDGAASGRHTVLLVHGTGGTPDEVWGWNYARALPAAGFGVCTVMLPERAMGDFAISAEYAAFAAQRAHAVSGRPIGILGHSQGGLIAAWITTFWPEVAAVTSDVIGLEASMNGTQLADILCTGGHCAPISWQMSTTSQVATAFRNAPLPSGPAYTSIASENDEIVFPQPAASQLPRGTMAMLQDRCHGRFVDHGMALADALAFEIVVDALEHDGPADPGRLPDSVCSELVLPELDPVTATHFAQTTAALTAGLVNPEHWVAEEPPLPTYAVPYAS